MNKLMSEDEKDLIRIMMNRLAPNVAELPCPECDADCGQLPEVIIHLYEAHSYDRKQVAQWLRAWGL